MQAGPPATTISLHVLKELHWLPVNYQIPFKIRVVAYTALQCQSPVYIRNLLQVYTPTRNLRSQNNATVLVVPNSRKVMFGDIRFAVPAPRLLNTLPEEIRDYLTSNVLNIPENKFTDNKLLVYALNYV